MLRKRKHKWSQVMVVAEMEQVQNRRGYASILSIPRYWFQRSTPGRKQEL